MIQVYGQFNQNFERNGNMTLTPTLATVHVVLNGVWSAKLEHPIDTLGRWKHIQPEAVIKMPSYNGEQLFRVKKLKKQDSGIKADLEPVFYDASEDAFTMGLRHWDNGLTADEALAEIMEISPKRGDGTPKYFAGTTLKTVNFYNYYSKNLMEILTGDDENNRSFISQFGGEIEYDNFHASITKIGKDNGVKIMYGRNIPRNGITEEVDSRNIVTRIYPLDEKGNHCEMEKDTGIYYVDSDLIHRYHNVKIALLKIDNMVSEEEATPEDRINRKFIYKSTEEKIEYMRKICENQFLEGADKPLVRLDINIVKAKAEEADIPFSELEKIKLGETVYCMHEILEIESKERVVELEYDSINERATGIKIDKIGRNDSEKWFNIAKKVAKQMMQGI